MGEAEYFSVASDGWGKTRKSTKFINFCIHTAKFGTTFHKAVDIKEDPRYIELNCTCTAQYTANLMIAAIKEIGASKVVGVVTDNAEKGSWPIIEAAFPHLTCYGCAAHTLNLMLKDWGNDDWCKDVIKVARDLVTWINNHAHVVDLARNCPEQKTLYEQI